MEAKEYLQRLKHLDTMINQKKRELSNLRLTAGSPAGIDYSKERVQTSPSIDAPFVYDIHKIIELEKEINTEINRFFDEKHKIINQIQSLQNTQYIEILYKKYVEFKQLTVIAEEMNYSYDYIKHVHGYALKNFSKKFLN